MRWTHHPCQLPPTVPMEGMENQNPHFSDFPEGRVLKRTEAVQLPAASIASVGKQALALGC